MQAPRSRYTDVVITGLAHVDADVVVSSDSLEAPLARTMERLGMPLGLLENLTGIKERRFWAEGVQPSDAATQAAEKLLAASSVDRADIGLVINTSVCRDFLEPSTASIVQGNLELGRATMNFDVGSACLGFITGANIASGMIERGEIEHALIVDGENSREVVSATVERLAGDEIDDATFREQFACLTLGSAGAAMLLSRGTEADKLPRYHGGITVSATQHHGLSVGDRTEMRTDSQQLLQAGLALAKDGFQEAAEEFGWNATTIDTVCMHQISQVHTNMLIDLLGLDSDRVPRTYPLYGNTGPAAVPTVMSKQADAGLLNHGDRLALMGMGSGINASAVEITW